MGGEDGGGRREGGKVGGEDQKVEKGKTDETIVEKEVEEE